jgi:hypothetical protein
MSAAQDLADALLAAGDPHTFRYGSIVATVRGFSANGDVLRVEQVEATYVDEPVVVDLPYEFVNAPASANLLEFAHQMIVDSVRYNGGL